MSELDLPFLELLLPLRNGSKGSYVGSSPTKSVERKRSSKCQSDVGGISHGEEKYRKLQICISEKPSIKLASTS